VDQKCLGRPRGVQHDGTSGNADDKLFAQQGIFIP
jgi:hypothetical protein